MLVMRLEVDDPIEWWRPLVQWVWCIPHLVYNAVATVLSVLAWVVTVPIVVATGKVPAVVARFQVAVLRERARTFGYLFVLRRSVPPFATALTAADPGDDPAFAISVDIAERAARTAPLSRLVVVAPHLFVLVPIGVCLDVLYPFWMAVVAVNRGWPAGLARTLAAVERWVIEVLLYATLVSDRAPQFGLAVHRQPAPQP